MQSTRKFLKRAWVGMTVKLHLKPEILLKFCKARSMPFSVRRKVELELQRLEAEG